MSNNISILFTEGLELLAAEKSLEAERTYVEASQTERHALVKRRPETAHKTLENGFVNFSTITTPYLYETLQENFGSSQASNPANWPLLYDLAALNSKQLDEFGNWFLRLQRGAFPTTVTEHTLNDGSSYLRFKKGFPSGILIPECDFWDRNQRSSETFDLGEVKTFGPTIGCPIIFEPKLVQALWAVYATHRQRIDIPSVDS